MKSNKLWLIWLILMVFFISLTIGITLSINQHHKASIGVTTDYNGPLRNFNTPRIAIMTIYHYDACLKCCGKTNGITASGVKATINHTIAADLPFGTVVYIDSVRYVVEDKGGGIKGNSIDMFVASHQEAVNRGKMQRVVFIYGGY